MSQPSFPFTMQLPDQLADLWKREITTANWFSPETEHLVVVCLDAELKVKAFYPLSVEPDSRTSVPARAAVFRPAFSMAAAYVVIIRHSPSGNPSPCGSDLRTTRQMRQAGEILGLPLMDFIIIGQADQQYPTGYVSLKEAGYLPDRSLTKT